MASANFNCYELLNVERGASQDEIRSSYRRLAKEYHPDAGGSASDEDAFARVAEAYRILSDTKLRDNYDSALDEQGFNHRAEDDIGDEQRERWQQPSPWAADFQSDSSPDVGGGGTERRDPPGMGLPIFLVWLSAFTWLWPALWIAWRIAESREKRGGNIGIFHKNFYYACVVFVIWWLTLGLTVGR